MFGLGLPEILVILVIILIIFGAKKLPEIGEGLGKTVKKLRKGSEERRGNDEQKAEGARGDLVSDLKKEIGDIPGLKEAKEIQQTVRKVRKITRFLR